MIWPKSLHQNGATPYFFVILNLLFSSMSAQSVNIGCTSLDCDFTDPSPNVAVYVLSIDDSDLTSDGYTQSSINWDALPNSQVVSETDYGSIFYDVQWANNPNAVTKRVTVSVNYTKAGSPTVTLSDEFFVTVKHIGNIPSMTIPGASPSSPNNGQTVSVPCGSSSFTISVGTPLTDPSTSVDYTWSLPSGWSGSSTSNSIGVTTDGSSGGTIQVLAERSDGNGFVTTSYGVNVIRPEVSDAFIQTADSWSPFDKPLCSGDSRQLSGASSPNATSYSWSTSGGISINSGGSSSVVTISGSSNGSVTLVASNACNSRSRTKNIFAGTPQIDNNDVYVDGHVNQYPNYTSGSSVINIENESSCQTYHWSIFGGSGFIYPNNCAFCGHTFGGTSFNSCGTGNASTSSSMSIRLRSANRCGEGYDVIIPLVKSGGYYYSVVSPNPATEEIIIAFEDKRSREQLTGVRLSSQRRSQFVRHFDLSKFNNRSSLEANKQIVFDVRDLQRGLYYLSIEFNNGEVVESETILLH